MKPPILIRTDGNAQIGLGHLVRCFALAHMLKNDFHITFICREIPDAIHNEIENGGFNYIKICKEDEFFGKLCNKIIIVLDGYSFDTNYQKRIKATGAKLVCIDDLHEKEFVADLIINHSPGIISNDYEAQPDTQFALGLEYVLLRPVFLEQAKKPRKIEKIETVLICFGGSDPKNLTQSTLKVVKEFIHFKKIIVITGVSYVITESFNQIITCDDRIDHRYLLKDQQMLDAMLEADLAIVPASGILFEALAAGCFVISGNYVDNQRFILEGFSLLNVIANTKCFSNLREVILHFIHHKLPLRHSLIDGNSKHRIINKIQALQK